MLASPPPFLQSVRRAASTPPSLQILKNVPELSQESFQNAFEAILALAAAAVVGVAPQKPMPALCVVFS